MILDLRSIIDQVKKAQQVPSYKILESILNGSSMTITNHCMPNNMQHLEEIVQEISKMEEENHRIVARTTGLPEDVIGQTNFEIFYQLLYNPTQVLLDRFNNTSRNRFYASYFKNLETLPTIFVDEDIDFI